jgi:hypothetical protein
VPPAHLCGGEAIFQIPAQGFVAAALKLVGHAGDGL